MLRIKDKLVDTKTRLQTLREQVDQALSDVPTALSLGENMNVQPVKLPLFVNAQLGFMAVYLLADYDDLARKLILAHHTALIDRSTLERWLNDGAHALRSLFSLAQQYRYSGTTRDDFAAKNAAARAAQEKFGELPQDVLEGTRRSRFPVPKKDGEYEDRGGFWAPVELWHRDAEHWQSLYQKGMRVLVEGRTVRDEWEDADENERVTFKIEARCVGILPYRIESVTLSAKPAGGQ